MPETVRLVSDGEELVLSTEEHYRIRSVRGTRKTATELVRAATSKPVAVQYLGFQDVQGRRAYMLRARRGDQEGHYILSIELAAFARRQALPQDGPDICYQKLVRELAESEVREACDIAVTEGDLVAYRERHSVPKRGRSSPPRSGERTRP